MNAAALAGVKLDRDRALATLPAINALKKLCCHPDMVRTLMATDIACFCPKSINCIKYGSRLGDAETG